MLRIGKKQENGNAQAYNRHLAKTFQFQVHDLGSEKFPLPQHYKKK